MTLFELRAIIESQLPWYIPFVLFMVANLIVIIFFLVWGSKK